MNILTKAVWLAVLAVVLSVVANALSPNRIPWVQDWSRHVETEALKHELRLFDVADVERAVQTGSHIILDARPEADYQSGRLPGALSMPFEEAAERWPDMSDWLLPELPIVVYCSGRSCDESLLLAVFLKESGLTNLYLFAGGYEAWTEAGHALEGAAP